MTYDKLPVRGGEVPLSVSLRANMQQDGSTREIKEVPDRTMLVAALFPGDPIDAPPRTDILFRSTLTNQIGAGALTGWKSSTSNCSRR